MALARQRLLTATYPWYELKDERRGPGAGFVYKHRQNNSGEEVGGIVPHVTLKCIANSEPPEQEVLVDRPETDSKITRVTGPLCVEATIPTAQDWDGVNTATDAVGAAEDGSFVNRMIEILRKTPVLRLEGNRTVTLKSVRPPAKSLSLSAEAAIANGAEKPVAFVFGPENAAVSEKLVYEAAREARAKNYTHLYVIGFAIQANARQLIEKCDSVVNIPATYVQATADLIMSDLLKNTRSSQVFSVCGMPEAELRQVKAREKDGPTKYEVELLGMDVFDPTTLEVNHRKGDDVPAWLLDADYNGLCFHASQVFFPRTGAWENLKKALKGEYEETVSRLAPSLDIWSTDSTVVLAAAAEGYFRGDVTVSAFKSVLKLHYSKFEDFIRLSKHERSVVRGLMNVDQYAKPIYPWQGEMALLDEEWAGCLGVADTKRFFALVDRLWKQNPEVRRILDVDVDHIEFCTPSRDTHRFRDFGISGHLMNLWSREVRSFQQPCAFRRWD